MQLLDYTKELIITLYSDGRIFFGNKTAQIVFGYSENEFTTKSIIDIISKNNYYDVSNKVLTSSNNTLLDDVVLKKQDGSEFYATIRVLQLSERTGEIAIFITDLTYRYEFRRELSKKIKIIESLGKSSTVRGGTVDEALTEILEKSIDAVSVTRVNVWLSNEDISSIECIGSYCVRDNQKHINESKGVSLSQNDLPKYFKMLQSEEVISTDDVMNDPQTVELVDSYLVPNKISSMLDVPLRSNGKMIGVICFEHTGPLRKWNVFEIKFGVLIAQIISLLIEGYEKSQLLRKQMQHIKEREELLNETNNRAKYIFGLMNTVLAVDENLCKDQYHKDLFLEVKNNLLNISGVHEIILDEKDFSNINLEKKILRIFGYMQNLYPQMQNIELDIKVNKVLLHISQAMTLGLIINQLIQISYEQSFKETKTGKISLTLHIASNKCILNYRDDGKELSADQINGELLELRLAELFVEDVKGEFNITTGGGNKFSLNFPLLQAKTTSEIAVN
jgi:PAS domain S-box-containing protein